MQPSTKATAIRVLINLMSSSWIVLRTYPPLESVNLASLYKNLDIPIIGIADAATAAITSLRTARSKEVRKPCSGLESGVHISASYLLTAEKRRGTVKSTQAVA